MTSPADELRAAATKLRETASKATPGRWQSEVLPPNERFTRPAYWVTTEYDDSSGTTDVVVADCPWREADAAWIALASPALAVLLAAWLEEEARLALRRIWDRNGAFVHAECGDVIGARCPHFDHILAVARAINGGQQS